MKKQSNNISQNSELAIKAQTDVNEIQNSETGSKIFTAADLWNIQRQAKGSIRRRFLA